MEEKFKVHATNARAKRSKKKGKGTVPSVAEIYSIAVGQIGIQPSEFWRMVPDEFFFAYKGWQQMKEQEYKNDWEMTRLIAFNSIAPHFDSKKLGRKPMPSDVMKFPWDVGEVTRKTRPVSRKKLDALFADEIAEFNKQQANANGHTN